MGLVANRLSPSSSNEDDYSRIQAAIDKVSKLEPNKDGFRGVLMFGKGVYRLSDTLRIQKSGIVLRRKRLLL